VIRTAKLVKLVKLVAQLAFWLIMGQLCSCREQFACKHVRWDFTLKLLITLVWDAMLDARLVLKAHNLTVWVVETILQTPTTSLNITNTWVKQFVTLPAQTDNLLKLEFPIVALLAVHNASNVKIQPTNAVRINVLPDISTFPRIAPVD
jgi:hypothetical protein